MGSRYFVGYRVGGEAADYYAKTAEDLAARFGVRDLSKYIPPHFTLKAPFETDNVALFKEELAALAAKERATPFTLQGFDAHSGGSVYLAVARNSAFQRQAEKLVHALFPFGERERTLRLPFMPHVSVARHLSDEEKAKVLSYLGSFPGPRLDLSFDGMTLFAHDGARWNAEETFTFQ
ncbi:MAG: 2'-5' RNA ligase family protein [bacterium]|nr:2'-5' RNA ligase family protein [bacterium]